MSTVFASNPARICGVLPVLTTMSSRGKRSRSSRKMRRQQVDASGRAGAEPNSAGRRPGMIRHRLQRVRGRRLDPADMRQQVPPRRGRLDPPPEPLQQTHPEPPFELADLQADRRLRQVQQLRRRRDAAERDDLLEGMELIEIELSHLGPAISQTKGKLMPSIEIIKFSFVMKHSNSRHERRACHPRLCRSGHSEHPGDLRPSRRARARLVRDRAAERGRDARAPACGGRSRLSLSRRRDRR